jgi:cytochrome bd-type quinol oxidase subunit 1
MGSRMKKQHYAFNHISLILGILASVSVVYTMLAIQIFKKDVFFDHVVSMPWEFAILVGTFLILLFGIISLGWVSHKILVTKKSTGLDTLALIWGVLNFFALMGTKVMADEIAREYRLGWETLGEWLGLYACLFFLFFYIILIFFLLRREGRDRQQYS